MWFLTSSFLLACFATRPSQGFFYRLQRRPLLAHGAEQFAGLLGFPLGHRGFRRALHLVGHLVNPVQHVGNSVFGGAGLAASAPAAHRSGHRRILGIEFLLPVGLGLLVLLGLIGRVVEVSPVVQGLGLGRLVGLHLGLPCAVGVGFQPCDIGILTCGSESSRGTLLGGQFDWGGRLLKSNGGVQRFAQLERKSSKRVQTQKRA